MDDLSDPFAHAAVTWRTAAEGGRGHGPPSGPVYRGNAELPDGTYLTILLQPDPDWTRTKVDFIARQLVSLTVGAEIVLMEGPTVVGRAVVSSVP